MTSFIALGALEVVHDDTLFQGPAIDSRFTFLFSSAAYPVPSKNLALAEPGSELVHGFLLHASSFFNEFSVLFCKELLESIHQLACDIFSEDRKKSSSLSSDSEVSYSDILSVLSPSFFQILLCRNVAADIGIAALSLLISLHPRMKILQNLHPSLNLYDSSYFFKCLDSSTTLISAVLGYSAIARKSTPLRGEMKGEILNGKLNEVGILVFCSSSVRSTGC